MQFLTCNSWQAGTENYVPREGTKCAIARHKKTFRLMCHGKAQNVPQDDTQCAIARHKNTFRQVPQEGTKCATGRHIMCHRTAHNVPQDGTKCAIARHKKTYVPREGTKCAILRHKKTFILKWLKDENANNNNNNNKAIIRAGRATLAAKKDNMNRPGLDRFGKLIKKQFSGVYSPSRSSNLFKYLLQKGTWINCLPVQCTM
jgi:hypothetical protein